MKGRIKTKYQIKNDRLFYEGQPTEIRIDDDYFFQGNEALDIYQEDGHIFVLKPLTKFTGGPRISYPVGLSIDSDGFVWGQVEPCIFDSFIKSTR